MGYTAVIHMYDARIDHLERESAKLESCLADCCRVIERAGLLAKCSKGTRDWYGKWRTQKRGKEPAGSECFKS